MPHGPAYHYAPDKMPDVFWEKSDGSVVGFWLQEWLDILGETVLKVTDKYEWEVWQPDLRADKVYSKTIETGVIHRLFPAKEKSFRLGIRSQIGNYSEEIISWINKYQNDNIILLLYGTFGFRIPFYIEILKQFGPDRKFPVFYRSGGMFKTPLGEVMELHRPLTYLCLLVEHFRLKKLLKDANIDIISEQSESALQEVRKIYNGRIEVLTMGCDFGFWVPAPSTEIKNTIREKFEISNQKVVFFASGNFTPRKQLDKLLEVFGSIQDRENFFLVIAGHGDTQNTATLNRLSESLVQHEKAMVHPYVTGEGLRDIYWASDVYLSVATEEGGPASVMKAMACGLPVVTTLVGNTADVMKKHDVGKFLSINDYYQWAKVIIEILDGDIPTPIDIGIARDAYDWKNVAKRFISVFDDLRMKKY